MVCSMDTCRMCQHHWRYKDILQTRSCFKSEAEMLLFKQFLQLMISPLVKKEDKITLQKRFPNYVEQIEKGG